MMKIDKNVPIPKIETLAIPSKIYPWEDMAVGDSFLMTPKSGESLTYVKRRAQAATKTKRARMHGEYTVLIVEGGVRVWLAEAIKQQKPTA